MIIDHSLKFVDVNMILNDELSWSFPSAEISAGMPEAVSPILGVRDIKALSLADLKARTPGVGMAGMMGKSFGKWWGNWICDILW